MATLETRSTPSEPWATLLRGSYTQSSTSQVYSNISRNKAQALARMVENEVMAAGRELLTDPTVDNPVGEVVALIRAQAPRIDRYRRMI
jgi:hypothetical protein